MAEHQWLTYTEIAKRFGISNDGARMLAKRKGWPKEPANYPRGPIRIGVPDGGNNPERPFPQENNPNVPEHPAARSPSDAGAVPLHVPLGATPSDNTLSLFFDALAQQKAEHHQREEQLRSDHAAEIARVQSLHLDLIGRIQAQASAERAIFMERVDAAEIRAESAETRAAAVDEKLHQVLDRLLERQVGPAPDGLSWWARWFGATKRSDIR